MKPTRVPFTLVLPLLNMLVWVLLIAVPTTIGVLHLRALAHGAPAVHLSSGPWNLNLPRSRFVSFSADGAAYRPAHWLTATNLPGLLAESWYPT